MYPLLFRIGPVPVYAFGAMMALGFLAAGVVMQRDFARKGEPPDLAWGLVAFGLVGGLLGARLHLAAYDWGRFTADPLGFLASPSGFVWYGGLAGGILATQLPIRWFHVSTASAADTAALGLALGLAFGRIGCHLSGDGDWGAPTTLPWGVAYPHGTAAWPHPPGVRVHPAALYEMAGLLAVFAVLLRMRHRLRRPGALFALYGVLAGGLRLLVETVRTNEPILVGLTEAQWTSLALVAGGGAFLAWRRD